VHWHQGDLLAPGSAKTILAEVKPSHLLHLAWFVVPGKLITSPENYNWVRASMELVQEFAAAGGKRLTTCGSGYEYDWAYGFCNEKLTSQVPNTVYGACKQALNLILGMGARLLPLRAARTSPAIGVVHHPVVAARRAGEVLARTADS
jgi:nucleoside-diphosphate-sugar epimerase